MEPQPRLVRCPACGQVSTIVWVHAHGQCTTCGTNIEPCCDGAPSDDGRSEDEPQSGMGQDQQRPPPTGE